VVHILTTGLKRVYFCKETGMKVKKRKKRINVYENQLKLVTIMQLLHHGTGILQQTETGLVTNMTSHFGR
jgi:hypothetical protein